MPPTPDPTAHPPGASVERAHVADAPIDDAWTPDTPPDPAPPAPVAEVVSAPVAVGGGAPSLAVASALTSATAPWWGGEAARWFRSGGALVVVFAAGLYLASPAGMAILGHTPVTSAQVVEELRPVVVEELGKARAQWTADAERERTLRDREREAKDRALQDKLDALAEEHRYQRGILEALRDRRR